MKPLLVGEAPGPNGDPERPLAGAPGAKLERFMGFEVKSPTEGGDNLRRLFDVRNLIDRPMERIDGTKGTEWPEEEAAEAARRLGLLVERGQRVVLLGKRVAKAWGHDRPYWYWRVAKTPITVVIPHPSGIVRIWNEPVNRVRAGAVLWQALGKEVP